MELRPRPLRPVGPPLGLYLRPGRNDHTVLSQLLVEGRGNFSGLVFDPCLDARHEDLRTEVVRSALEAVLDPRTVEMGTETGYDRGSLADLPWGEGGIHAPADLAGARGVQVADAVAQWTVDRGFTAVLAPTHYLRGLGDGWLDVDAALTQRLRTQLDAAGRHDVPVYYPLVIAAKELRDASRRTRLAAALQRLPVDAIWLRLHPFGTRTSGPVALRRYIEICQSLHPLGIPLVAERTGTVGLALLAFGAVGGIESGITFGERFDVAPLLRPPSNGDPFSPPPRVYLPDLGTFMSRVQAEAFFEHRQMKIDFACRNSACCRRGSTDMLADPRRHFLIRRMGEVATMSKAPPDVRPQQYLDKFLRPASDQILRAVRLAPELQPARLRLESWRGTLGGIAQNHPPTTFAMVPEGRRIDRRPRATGE